MLNEIYFKQSKNIQNLNYLLLQKALKNMNDEEFSALAKLSVTDEKLFNKIIIQAIVNEFSTLIINIENNL